MKSLINRNILPCGFLYLISQTITFSQPYIFSGITLNSGYVQIQQIDLSTGAKKLFVSDTLYPFSYISTDESNTWVYATKGKNENDLSLINIKNPTLRKELLNPLADQGSIEYYPQLNKIVILWSGNNLPANQIQVYDGRTLSLIDTTLFLPESLPYWMLSDDASTYLGATTDTLQDITYLQVYSFASKSLIRQRALNTIGHPTNEKYGVGQNRKGRDLFGYLYPPHDSSHGYELVYEPRVDSVLALIARPFMAEAALSADGNYVLLQETPLNPNWQIDTAGVHLITGKIAVYFADGGNFYAWLSLPDNGKMYFFDSYPSILYYYVGKKNNCVSIDLNKLISIRSINPTNILIGSGSFTLSVVGTNFTASSKVECNGVNRATTFLADTLLQATIRSGDVDASTTAYITVKDGDAMTDSLAINIASVLPQSFSPILDCVTQQNDTTYTAWFGYENTNSISITVPVGPQNKFTPTPNDRNQPTVFNPGRKDYIFSVVFNGNNLTWKLNGNQVVASKKSPKCN
jgi:hypothetical protein